MKKLSVKLSFKIANYICVHLGNQIWSPAHLVKKRPFRFQNSSFHWSVPWGEEADGGGGAVFSVKQSVDEPSSLSLLPVPNRITTGSSPGVWDPLCLGTAPSPAHFPPFPYPHIHSPAGLNPEIPAALGCFVSLLSCVLLSVRNACLPFVHQVYSQ